MARWSNYKFHLHKIAELPVHHHEGTTHEDEHEAVAVAKAAADLELAAAKQEVANQVAVARVKVEEKVEEERAKVEERVEEERAKVEAGVAAAKREVQAEHVSARRAMDKRLLVLYVLIIVVFASVLGIVRNEQRQSDEDRIQFENAIVDNCVANKRNTENFNNLIDRLLQTYADSPVLSEEERQQRIDFFTPAKGEVPECPPKFLEE
jgi:cobalamin biosynthesis Mg chelatase CobN